MRGRASTAACFAALVTLLGCNARSAGPSGAVGAGAPPSVVSATRGSPCDTPRSVRVLRTPLARTVKLGDSVLGVLHVDRDGTSTFEPDGAAPAEAVQRFQAVHREVTSKGSVGVAWQDRAPDGAEYSCGADLQRSDPRYPAALLRELSGKFDGRLLFVPPAAEHE